MACENGHVWTNQFGDDWTPERGTPCDCRQKKWGIPLSQAREHLWVFYMNGSFCQRCGEPLGSHRPCY